ncbi:MAG: hypothetical protein C0404_11525 [Verrucomicrobia bacterium]|nr:hypothetical protein [Verrucomicrobiota bacterium]
MNETNETIQRDAKAGGKRGSALVIVMCLAGVLMIAGAAMTYLAGNATMKSRKLQYGARSLAVAEAGVAEMLSRMSTNYMVWSDNNFSMTYDGGSCSVTSKLYTNNGHVLITSTALVGSEQRTTVLELLGNLWDVYDHTVGEYGAIVAGGNVIMDSSACQIYGGIHANGSIYNTMGNPTIYGDVTSSGPTNQLTPADSTYDCGTNSPPVVVPNYWDEVDTWRNLAISGGLVFGASFTTSGIVGPGNGVTYVNGNATFQTGSGMTGVLIATGNITVEQRFDHYVWNNMTNWPCLIAGGSISEANQNSYNGVIFARGNITIDNRRRIFGMIISYTGNVDIKNNTDIYPLPVNPAWVPSDTNDRPPQILMGGWLSLLQ